MDPDRSPDELDPQGSEPHTWQRDVTTAGEIMTVGVRCVAPQTTLEDIARVMRDENCGVVPVVDTAHRLIGILTDRDLIVRAVAEGKPLATTRADEVMTNEIEAVTSDEPVEGVIELMGRRQVRRVPVVDRDDRLIGIVSMGDIATRADYDEELREALERVSARRRR
jgi:CBS domain-containing protein